MSPVAEIAVEVSKDLVIVHLTISNVSANADLRVEKRKIFASPPLQANFFQVTCDGKPVRYVGPMAKMRAPGPDDFLQVPPGSHVRGTADITSLYAFLPGQHEYTISYSAFFDDPNDNNKLVKVTSNKTSFVLKRVG